MGFSRQEYWSVLPCSPPGDLLDPGIKLTSPVSPAWAGGFFTASANWEAYYSCYLNIIHLTSQRIKSYYQTTSLPHQIQFSLCIQMPFLMPSKKTHFLERFLQACCAVPSHSVMPNSLQPRRLQPARLLIYGDSPGKNTMPSSRGSSQPRFATLPVDSLPAEPLGKPQNTGVGSLSLLWWVFPTQELNWGLLHCRQTLY